MSCFVFVVLAGGWGFSLFWGVVLACPSCFLGLLGFPGFLLVLLLIVGVGGGLWGVPGFGGWRACFLLFFSWGVGLGVRLRASGSWLSGSGCGRGRLVGGRGCACCPVPVVGVGLCPASRCVVGVGLRPVSSAACCGGGFRVLFFPSGASRVFWFCGAWSFVGLWFPRGRGVVGGVGLGSGLFFLRLLLYWPGLVSGFLRGGLVWVWVGFCLESLILAQDERWRRA